VTIIEYRPEQVFAGEVIKKIMPKGYQFFYEKEVTDLKPIDGIEIPFCKPDIVLINHERKMKIAIRFNGTYHDKDTQRRKDEFQKLVLEGNGYRVIDFNHFEMPSLWFGNKEKYDERQKALHEILEKLQFEW